MARVGNQGWQPDLWPVFRPRSDAAIDYAEKDGKAGRPAKVLVQEDGRTFEPFGLMDATRTPARQAILQMAGPPGHIACHDCPVSDTATCQFAGAAIVHRIR